MIFTVELTEQAENDLRSIYEYISHDLQSPENAEGQLGRLIDRILSLENLPERFRRYENEPWRGRGLRIVPVDNYVVLYIPDTETKVVTIIRIMYGGQDIENFLAFYAKQ
ncbi:RelE/StbE family addiction module toxin [Lachnospiraceae bacterium MD308]|nr:RelE/StbE family addiction module toxin [Lachnospiraceae bacterium MD308]MCI8503991.1 type II toxin-antitoxin system RelE/ParE family toxin [Dorea sp.]